MKTSKRPVLFIFLIGLLMNLVLFGVKLDVGLSVNSICIFSDAVNNLFDALSCLLSFGCMAAAQRVGQNGALHTQTKAEQLLSMMLSIIVAFVGAAFAYNSLERLMYPTPVWFSMKYFFIVLLTALAKLALYFFYRRYAKRFDNPVLRVMKTDSLLDCFITTSTLLSFTLTRYLSFAVDAVFGLAISAVILIQALRMIVSAARVVLDVVNAEDRAAFERCILESAAVEAIEAIRYDREAEAEVCAYVRIRFCEGLDAHEIDDAAAALQSACLKQTGIRLELLR